MILGDPNAFLKIIWNCEPCFNVVVSFLVIKTIFGFQKSWLVLLTVSFATKFLI